MQSCLAFEAAQALVLLFFSAVLFFIVAASIPPATHQAAGGDFLTPPGAEWCSVSSLLPGERQKESNRYPTLKTGFLPSGIKANF